VVGAPAARDVDLERVPGGVVTEADELDREVELGPVAVDLVAAAVDVRARSRQAVGRDELEKAILECAERDV